jgi:hypothetical protein
MKAGNKGSEAALAAIRMASIKSDLASEKIRAAEILSPEIR